MLGQEMLCCCGSNDWRLQQVYSPSLFTRVWREKKKWERGCVNEKKWKERKKDEKGERGKM